MSAGSFPSADAEGPRPAAHPRTLVLCDLADSTALFERVGDQSAAELIRRHDSLARSAIQRHGGREIDKTDGFLVLFERPIQAVAFALEYQRGLRALAGQTNPSLNARIGIHFGEVVDWENPPSSVARGAKPLEVEGVAKPVTARLMSLALPGQILLSEAAEAMAQRAGHESGMPTDGIRWLSHGRYRFKGIAEPMAVYEVGEPGIAPLRRPPASAKAHPDHPWWRQPMTLAGASLVLVAAGVVAWYVGERDEARLEFGERDWVVVGDVVNLSGDGNLDSMVRAAFRIGVEESRFVNVVPEMVIRQTLARMQRDGTTRIDREIGSEIALREQARAVIMPSVAQYGQQVRLVVELIDPQNARTVSIQTIEANGPQDILPALDRLLRDTRHQLGESLQQIQATSQPLEKVITPNLEALRAMARALEMERDGEFDQSERLLRHAIELDPDFASAHSRLGSVLVQQERYPEARAILEKALAINGRLSERDRLFIRAFLAEFDDPESALSQWRVLANLYPDNGAGDNNAGNLYYQTFHDYPAAELALTRAAVPRNPLRNYTMQMLGHALLAGGKPEMAEVQFRAALQFAPAPILFGLADAFAVSGKFQEAARYLDEVPRQPPDAEIERAMRQATLLIGLGRNEAAAAAIETALALANRQSSPNSRWRAQAAMVALHAAQGDVGKARALAARHLAELSAATRTGGNPLVIEELLHAAAWAARLGLGDAAGEALTLAALQHGSQRFPVRARLAAVVQDEIDLYAGRAGAILARQQPNAGTDLWEMHEVRARAFGAAGDIAAETAERRWLVEHSGLAHGQWTDQLLGQQARALALVEARARIGTANPPR